MRCVIALGLAIASCVPQRSVSKFNGVELGNCPPQVDGAALTSLGADVSPDLAEQRARAAFNEDHGLPDSLKPTVQVRSLAGCQGDDGRYFVAVGLSNDDLTKQREVAQKSPASLHAAIAQVSRIRRWNQFCTFLRQQRTQCETLDDEAARRLITETGGTIRVHADPNLSTVLKASVVQALLEVGVRVIEGGETSQLTLVVKTESEPLPVTEDQRRFVRERLTITMTATTNQILAERTWEAKGGGLDSDQAGSNARRELAAKVRAEAVTSLFWGDTP